MANIKQMLETRLTITDYELMQAALEEINNKDDEIKKLHLRLATVDGKPVKPEPKPIPKFPWKGGAQQKLTNYDIPRIAHTIGVGEDEIHAVLDVETRGFGFDKHGVIRLFEEHVFHRYLPKSLRQEAINKGLAHPKWRRNYKNNYNRFLKAYEFHPKAALKACSWGLGQVMGFNHQLAGYDTVFEMVEAFAQSEGNQLKAMVEFIRSAGLDDELRDHDWAGFARGYNGRGYKKNRYDTRLRARYQWWQKKPDTPWTPEIAKNESLENEPLAA